MKFRENACCADIHASTISWQEIFLLLNAREFVWKIALTWDFEWKGIAALDQLNNTLSSIGVFFFFFPYAYTNLVPLTHM